MPSDLEINQKANKEQSKTLELPLLEIHYPTLECTVLGSGKSTQTTPLQQIQVTALLDSGFDDFLSIPRSLAKQLSISCLKETEVQLGDGSQVTVDVGECQLKFPFADEILVVNTIIDEDDECLIGMSLISAICSAFKIDFEKQTISLFGLNI
jgi:clan AA aspartic protease